MKILKIACLGLAGSILLAASVRHQTQELGVAGRSPSPIIDRTGRLVWLYVDDSGFLSLGRQNTAAGKFSVWKRIDAGKTAASPCLKEDRAGCLRALWIEEGAGTSEILLGRVQEDKIIERNTISQSSEEYFSPDFDFDASNAAWIAWIERRDRMFKIFVRETGREKIWLVSPPSLLSASQVRILAGGPDGPWVFWTGRDIGRDEIFCSRLNGEIWSRPARLNTDHSLPHIDLNVYLDPEGRPGALWSAYDGQDYELYRAVWEGNSWSAEEKFTYNRALDDFPSLVFFRGTEPIIIWSRSQGPKNSICARFGKAGGMDPEIEIFAAVNSDLTGPKIAVRGGRLSVFWQSGQAVRWKNLTYEEMKTARPLTSSPPQTSAATAPALDENKYIGFGDSITSGEINHEPAPDLGYVPRLDAILDEKFGPSVVINEGFPGDQTIKAIVRIDEVLAKHAAGYLLLMEGTNDVIHLTISADTAAFNIEEMIKKCRDFGTLPILSTIIPRSDSFWFNKLYRDRLYEINEKINRIRIEKNVVFVDMFSTFFNYPVSDGGWQSLISDGVHPNEKGYEIMAHAWWDAIRYLPFPPHGLTVTRDTEHSLLFSRKVNSLTWQHSLKIGNPFQFRTYKIYRKDLTGTPAGSRLIASIPYSPFFNPQKYEDPDIQETHSYEYLISLLRIDLIESLPSAPAKDSP